MCQYYVTLSVVFVADGKDLIHKKRKQHILPDNIASDKPCKNTNKPSDMPQQKGTFTRVKVFE